MPFEQIFVWLPEPAFVRHAAPIGFTQLLPVWFLITYLFVQPLLHNSLKAELVRLRELNVLLATSGGRAGPAAERPGIRWTWPP